MEYDCRREWDNYMMFMFGLLLLLDEDVVDPHEERFVYSDFGHAIC